jgi:hypothetical protein
VAALKARANDIVSKNHGPLARFAGMYDATKDCDAKNFTIAPWVLMQTRRFVWFEGNHVMLSYFSTPDQVQRAELVPQRKVGPIQFYRATHETGMTESLGFGVYGRQVRFAYGLEPSGKYLYSVRCDNQDELISWAERLFGKVAGTDQREPSTSKIPWGFQ